MQMKEGLAAQLNLSTFTVVTMPPIDLHVHVSSRS
jgi:hypothetical protein